MNIALYYPWIYLTSGAERTILEIARRSRHDTVIFTNEYQPHATFPEFAALDVRVMHRVSVKRSLAAVGGAAATILRQKIDFSGFDALLVVCEGLGDLVALRHKSIPSYCLCLTPLRIVYDPVYRASYLSGRSLSERCAIAAGSAAYRVMDRVAWRRYRRVFPISAEVKARIMAGRLASESRLQILHPGVELADFSPSASVSRTFFVPGRVMWTKNLELAIEAFRRFRTQIAEPETWRLRIAGIVDRKSEAYFGKLRALAAGDPAIEFVVRPSDEEMRAGYRDCFATLFTALNEDWGLVMIEAMASGRPVVAVNRGGPREIVRHGHDGLLASADPQMFAEAMLRLAQEPGLHGRLAGNGPASAARFGWSPFVRQLDDAIEADLGRRSTPAAIHEWQEAGV